ncbi:MAG: hypothetical protein LBG98_03695 [Puniceicoccales bacterium]|jgi:hypothetical protein|nr:hypothetical protein [Puniceicoccales bacterium]
MRHLLKVISWNLLAASLCVSGYAEWDPKALAAAIKYFSRQNHPEVLEAIASIDYYTNDVTRVNAAALNIIAKNPDIAKKAGIKEEYLSQIGKELASAHQNALDIQTQASDVLITLLPAESSDDDLDLNQTSGVPPTEESISYINHFLQELDPKYLTEQISYDDDLDLSQISGIPPIEESNRKLLIEKVSAARSNHTRIFMLYCEIQQMDRMSQL